MRRATFALSFALLPFVPVVAHGQQTQAPPPPTSTSQRVTVALPSPPQGTASVVVSEPRVAGQAPVATAERVTAFVRNATPASWQNVRLDVVITDSLVPDSQSRKAVSMLILDGLSGQIRTSAGEGLINIDARPTIRPDGRVYLQLTIEYRPELSAQQLQQAGLSRTALFTESLALLVPDGKPTLASQSADPRSERKVAIEVTASVAK